MATGVAAQVRALISRPKRKTTRRLYSGTMRSEEAVSMNIKRARTRVVLRRSVNDGMEDVSFIE